MKILMLLSKPLKTDPRVNKEKCSLEKQHDVKIIYWDRKNNSRILYIFYWWFQTYRNALSLYKSTYRFDVVHCHDLDTLIIGFLLKWKTGVRLVYDAHEIYGYMIEKALPGFIGCFASLFERLLIKNADAVITVNQPLKEYFLRITRSHVYVVMNCSDISDVEKRSSCSSMFTVGYFGVFDRSRMFPEILSVLGTIDGVRFMVAGRGPLYDSVERISTEMVYCNIVFLKELPYVEVIERTKECDVILSMLDPGNRNNKVGLPNKVFEAMATGKPMIVTKGIYCGDFVEMEECGISVEYDLAMVKNAVMMLRDNPITCAHLGRNGLRAAHREYNWSRQEQILFDVYREVFL